MATTITQTDTAAPCGADAGCSGASLDDEAAGWAASPGGTAGSTELTATLAALSGSLGVFMYEWTPGADYSGGWAAGNYTIPINVSTGNNDLRLNAVYICRFNGSCVNQETLGSETGLDVKLAGGVETRTIAGSAVASPADTDKIYIIVVVENVNTMFTRTLGVTPDQNITTPLSGGGGLIQSLAYRGGMAARSGLAGIGGGLAA